MFVIIRLLYTCNIKYVLRDLQFVTNKKALDLSRALMRFEQATKHHANTASRSFARFRNPALILSACAFLGLVPVV